MTKNVQWVDFRSIKGAVDLQQVHEHYGISTLRKSGDELRGPCPIHKGLKRSNDFTVNVRKNAFNRFSQGCGARGNVLDFVAALEKCSVRDAALKLQDWFNVGESLLRLYAFAGLSEPPIGIGWTADELPTDEISFATSR